MTPAVGHQPTEHTHSAAPPEHACIQCISRVNLGSTSFLKCMFVFLKLKVQSITRHHLFGLTPITLTCAHTYFVACRCYLFSLQKVSGERLSRARPRRLPWEDKQQGLGKRQAENPNRWPLPGPHPLTWYTHTHIHSKRLRFTNADQNNRRPGDQASCLFCSKKTVKGYLYHRWAFRYNVKTACYSYRRLKQKTYIRYGSPGCTTCLPVKAPPHLMTLPEKKHVVNKMKLNI